MTLQKELTILIHFLTPTGVERLARALEALSEQSDGWGKVEIEMKAGKVDVVNISSSIRIRKEWREDLNNPSQESIIK
jgi:hypothetical protein